MQDWEYTTNELIHYAEGQNELLHHRTKGALNKKVAQYIRDGGKLINGKIVYAKKALSNKMYKTGDAMAKAFNSNKVKTLASKNKLTKAAMDKLNSKGAKQFRKELAYKLNDTYKNKVDRDRAKAKKKAEKEAHGYSVLSKQGLNAAQKSMLERSRKNSGYTGPTKTTKAGQGHAYGLADAQKSMLERSRKNSGYTGPTETTKAGQGHAYGLADAQKSMLERSRKNSGYTGPTEITKAGQGYATLSKQGLSAAQKALHERSKKNSKRKK